MWRHVAANALTFFVVALFLVAGAVALGARAWREPGPLAQAICLTVEPNTNFRALSRTLAERGAVSSPAVFGIGVDYGGRADDLKAGSHLIPARASMSEIVDVVTAPGASTCGSEIVTLVGVARTTTEVRTLDPATGEFVDAAAFDPTTDAPPPEFVEASADPGRSTASAWSRARPPGRWSRR